MTKTLTASVAPHPVHTIHRVGIGILGLFLLSFGIWGLAQGVPFLSAQGLVVMGLSTNGLLAAISVVVSAPLIAAAIRGGRAASTVGIALGTLFLISGIVNMFLIGTTMNMLAFGLTNVVFSLVVGMALLFTGAYGRLTGNLPPDSPYYHGDRGPEPDVDDRTPAERITDHHIDAELAEAERAVARHQATTEQAEGVRRAAEFRAPADRRRAFRSA
jgi:hypothetical protein